MRGAKEGPPGLSQVRPHRDDALALDGDVGLAGRGAGAAPWTQSDGTDGGVLVVPGELDPETWSRQARDYYRKLTSGDGGGA